MENFYDMTKVSKKVVDKNRRIEQQAADYISKYDQSLREEAEAKEAKQLNDAMSAARYGYASSVARSKNRVNKLSEEIKYTNDSSIIGMAEMVAEVVEKSLLLDESELIKIYPEYKKDIRGIVKGFLKEGDINQVITNNDTLTLMEYVAKALPGVREGKNLTEDELANYIALSKPVDIDKSIKNLSGDISASVATLMEKEQNKVDKLDKDIKKVKDKKEKEEEKKSVEEISVDKLVKDLTSGKLSDSDVDEMLKNGEISQDTYDEVVAALDSETAEKESTEEDIDDDIDVSPETVNDEVHMDQAASFSQPKKQIQMLPDGTMNINMFEDFDLVKETPRCGLIESLAVNEAVQMLSEGKAYDPDLCIAKAIMYTTITEAMNAMGLMNVDEKKYSQIISAAGGSLLEISSGLKKAIYQGGKKAVDNVNGMEKAAVKAQNASGKYPNTTSALNSTINKVDSARDLKIQKYLTAKTKKNVTKESLSESILVNQYVPNLNSAYDPNSIAERIRRKRLNEQTNLNE